MIVAYEGNRGNRITLTEPPYYLNVEELLNYEWQYATKDRRRGSIVAGFSKNVSKRAITLHIIGDTEEERNAAIDAFNNVVETDIYDGVAGKIWFGEWFTYGYITGASNSKWQYGVPVVKKEVQLVREQDSWYHIISKTSYDVEEEPEEPSNEGIKTYEEYTHSGSTVTGYDFTYDYMEDLVSRTVITNPNNVGAEFVVGIQGPVIDPQLKIGDTVIHVSVTVPDGGYLTVDSTAKTVVVTRADGSEVNAFGARDPNYYIFEPIASGDNVITWNGAFPWEIKLIEERSEPRWRTG